VKARPSSPLKKLVVISLFAFAAAVFANSVANDFVLDDRIILLKNPDLRSLAGIPRLFAADYWHPYTKAGLYRPLVTASYALNHWVGGVDPVGYHALNVALHALASLLVWALFRRLPVSPPVALGGAFLFAAHAVHTEAVAGVVGRAELLCAVFFLGALLGSIDAGPAGTSKGRRRRAVSLALYASALLSKENAVTLPAVLLLHDLVYARLREQRLVPRLGRLLRDRLATRYAPYLLLTAAYLAVRHLVLAGGEPVNQLSVIDNPLVSLDLAPRLLNALAVAWRYVGLLLFPLDLSYDYSYDQIEMLRSVADPRALGALAASAAVFALFVWTWLRWRDLFYALGFFAITFSLASNLVVVIGTILGERLLYLPSVGFCLGVTLLLEGACRALLSPRAARAAFAGLLVAAVGLHAARAVVRSADWRSEYRLFLHDLQVAPRSAKVQGNAGLVLLEHQQLEEAIVPLRRATEIAPDRQRFHSELGDALLLVGRESEAIAAYEKAVRLPGASPSARNNLGFLLVERGLDPDRGLALIEQAVALEPASPQFLDSLGWTYYRRGRLREARELIAKSLALEASGASGDARRAHLREVERALAERAGP